MTALRPILDRHRPALLAALAFALAAALALAAAVVAAGAIETRARAQVERRLIAAGFDWVAVATDGLTVTLAGTAPSEAARFRAVSLAGGAVDARRIHDAITVEPATPIAAPRFSVELLRNEDGVSVIGLVPLSWDATELLARAGALDAAGEAADMLQAADFPVPEGWDAAMGFGLVALDRLPRSKISVAAGQVTVSAIADSTTERSRIEAELNRAVPPGVRVSIAVAAPRPVIAPFTLRFVIDAAGARFDACAADSERARTLILAAAREAGFRGEEVCRLGLGAPSPRWSDAAAAGIAALARLGAGTLTLSDTDITLVAAETVAAAEFERVAGELTSRLPDVFSLRATRVEPPRAETQTTIAQFTATLDAEGRVELRGRLADARMRALVEAMARAAFGAEQVYAATRLDPAGLPEGWAIRVLAAIEALDQLHDGAVLVQPDAVEVRGNTGSADARARIAQILSSRLGQGAAFRVDVHHDPALDAVPAAPTPAGCVEGANAVLSRGEITFAPGSADLVPGARGALRDLADVLRRCIDVPLEVGGHTDSQGRAETNLALSHRRAEAVIAALLGQRVPIGNLAARGYGAAEPVADNATEAGREANRRIAIRLVEPEAAAGAAPAGGTPATDPPVTDPPDGETPEGETPEGETPGADPDGTDSPGAGEPDGSADAPPLDDHDAAAADPDPGAEAGESATTPPPPRPAAAETVAAPAAEQYDSAAPATVTLRPRRRPADR
jgi:OOP family OmpA-OmpF porin